MKSLHVILRYLLFGISSIPLLKVSWMFIDRNMRNGLLTSCETSAQFPITSIMVLLQQ